MIVRAASLTTPLGWHFDVGNTPIEDAKRMIRESHALPDEVEWAWARTFSDLQRSEMPAHYRDQRVSEESADGDKVQAARERMSARSAGWAKA